MHADIINIRDKKFQFHYGSVKSLKYLKPGQSRENFNSTMVRLKENFSLSHSRLLQYFNSTMVRLKGSSLRTKKTLPTYFNSTMVRLKVQVLFFP